nr:Calcium/calmodulin-dependent protein kinase [Ipomoea batatas]
MPQVDLETLVSACAGGGTDRKIACETLADGRVESDEKRDNDDSVDDYEKRAAPDLLPESFLISKDAEFDWTQKNNYVDSMRRSCSKPANIRLFPPRRAESMGKPVGEPSSPKVSCIGRVRSKRGRRKSSPQKLEKSRSVGGREKSKTGFYSRLVSVFLSNRGKKPAEKIEKETPSRKKSVKETKSRQVPVVSIEPLAEPPGLGGMKRFASGRKSESWGANEINAAVSDAFGTERR